jgi:hypothetical protein
MKQMSVQIKIMLFILSLKVRFNFKCCFFSKNLNLNKVLKNNKIKCQEVKIINDGKNILQFFVCVCVATLSFTLLSA